MMKQYLLVVIMSTFTLIAFSQDVENKDVKLKGNDVLLDNVKIMKYEKRKTGREIGLIDLGTNEEIIIAQYLNGGNSSTNLDDYYRIIFVKQNKSMEYLTVRWNKAIVKWLIKERVLSEDGKLNEDRIDGFIEEFDKHVTETRGLEMNRIENWK